eukprot:scaffold286407_cov33-Tisochrysis_lutea.AAC.2
MFPYEDPSTPRADLALIRNNHFQDSDGASTTFARIHLCITILPRMCTTMSAFAMIRACDSVCYKPN